jgi:hypothetical protein
MEINSCQNINIYLHFWIIFVRIFIFFYLTVSVTEIIKFRVIEWSVNKELERMSKE